MPFYRLTDGNLERADAGVAAPDYDLRAEEHSTYTYPVGGWYWLDSDAEAIMLFAALMPPPADRVTPLQARRALSLAGVRDAFEAWASDSARTREERDYLEYATVWERQSPMIAAGAAALGLSEAQIDQLFALAASL